MAGASGHVGCTLFPSALRPSRIGELAASADAVYSRYWIIGLQMALRCSQEICAV